jgi:hypothetical protein
VKRGILLLENARCCSSHTYEALEMIESLKIDNLTLNGDDLKNLRIDIRLTINTTKSDNNFGNSIFVLFKIIFTMYLISFNSHEKF